MNYNSANDFLNLSNLLVDNIKEISNNVNSLQRLVNQLGSAEDSVLLRSQLHELQQKTNGLAKECNSLLKEISKLSQSSNPTEQRERKLRNEKIRNDFIEILNKFQELQRNATQREKENIILKTTPSRTNNPFYKNDETTYESNDNSSQPQAVLQIEEEERHNLQLIKSQHEAIKRLESDIVDVNQIFQDLGRMVHEQQEIVDSIETNVQTTQIQLETGNQQLQVAALYQKKARKKKALIVVVLVIILIIITLIIYFSVN